MTAMETGAVAAATVTVAVAVAGNSWGRQQSTTSSSIVAKTAVAVAGDDLHDGRGGEDDEDMMEGDEIQYGICRLGRATTYEY